MSSTGNQYFSKVENTVLAPSTLNSQQVKGSLSSLKQITGTCVPTAIGDYAVVDEFGEPITVKTNLPIIAAVLSCDLPLVSAGAATVSFGLTSTRAGALVAPIFLPGPVPFGLVNQSVTSPPNAGNPFVGVSNQFLTVEIAGAVITSGIVRATLLTF
jgi:hypothetical protein